MHHSRNRWRQQALLRWRRITPKMVKGTFAFVNADDSEFPLTCGRVWRTDKRAFPYRAAGAVDHPDHVSFRGVGIATERANALPKLWV